MIIKLKWPDSIKDGDGGQFSSKFLQGMLDRMAFGFYNYGPVAKNFPDSYDAIKSLSLRLKKYKETKNTEFLMDAANFAMIEFLFPRVKGAHFRSTSRHESPGSVHRKHGIVKGKDDIK